MLTMTCMNFSCTFSLPAFFITIYIRDRALNVFLKLPCFPWVVTIVFQGWWNRDSYIWSCCLLLFIRLCFQLLVIVPDLYYLGWNFHPQERTGQLSKDCSISNNSLITNYFHIAWTVFIFHKLHSGLDVLGKSKFLTWINSGPAMSCCHFCFVPDSGRNFLPY